MPVLFGPNNEKFQEAQGLKASGGGFDFSTPEEFHQLMDRLVADAGYCKACGSKAGAFVKDRSGATGKILSSVSL